MKHTSLSDLRRNLSKFLNGVNADHEPLVVTRRRGKPVVVLSLEDYEALGRHSAPKPRSASVDHLLKSLTEVDEMRFVPKALEDQ